jgi:hypothetical protein
MTASMQTGTAVETSAFQASHTTGVVGLPDTTSILAKYLDQLLNGETGDGRFVRVPASKEFYLFSTDTIEPSSGLLPKKEPLTRITPVKFRLQRTTKFFRRQSIWSAQFRMPLENRNPNEYTQAFG